MIQQLKEIIFRPQIFLVDLENDVVVEVPVNTGQKVKVCTNPERWEPGMFYIPNHANLVKAISPADARRKMEEIMECAETRALKESLFKHA